MVDRVITKWPEDHVCGSKRTNVEFVEDLPYFDWFEGYGKDDACRFEGSWWDMICFARNVLASENTRLAAPEFHKPEWAIDRYTVTSPYKFEGGRTDGSELEEGNENGR